MTTNFTLRDFFVYLLAGLTLIISFGAIFSRELLHYTVDFFDKYTFIVNFSFIITILLIPTIYLLGHIIGSISYNMLRMYIFLDNGYFKRPTSKFKYFILINLRQILYKQRVVYAIIEFTKSKKTDKPFKTVDEFWKACAKLQIEKIYTHAEYWYVLNELFNSLNLIFFFSAITALIKGNWILGIIFSVLTIFSFKRARQYAEHFIQTVCNLTIVKQTIKNN